MGMPQSDSVSELSLPPGFRFYPTDEELMVQYLCRKISGQMFSLQIIGEIDLYKFDPWVLPSKALFGEKEWYFFSPRDRKYPNGSRPNRVAGSGYWKATGTDKIIASQGRRVGIKKALVFYVGKAPKGIKTNWIMHEYRLSQTQPTKNTANSSKLDEWVLCRIYKKSSGAQKPISANPISAVQEESNCSSSSCSSTYFEDVLESLPEINDQTFVLPRINSLKALDDEKFSLQSTVNNGKFDWNTNIMQNMNILPDMASTAQIQPAQGEREEGIYLPPIPQMSQKFGTSHQEEGESVSGLTQQSSYGMNQPFIDSFDAFGKTTGWWY